MKKSFSLTGDELPRFHIFSKFNAGEVQYPFDDGDEDDDYIYDDENSNKIMIMK